MSLDLGKSLSRFSRPGPARPPPAGTLPRRKEVDRNIDRPVVRGTRTTADEIPGAPCPSSARTLFQS